MIAAADALVMPSSFESLSMVALEAWALGRPVLANGRCDVLSGSACAATPGCTTRRPGVRGDAGTPARRPDAGRGDGRRTDAPSTRHYAWPVIEGKYLSMFDRLQTRSARGRAWAGCPAGSRRRRRLPPRPTSGARYPGPVHDRTESREASIVKLAFVTPRYGADIVGGPEHACRLLAEQISSDTTWTSSRRARGSRDWKNEYAEGPIVSAACWIRRFAVSPAGDGDAVQADGAAIVRPHGRADEFSGSAVGPLDRRAAGAPQAASTRLRRGGVLLDVGGHDRVRAARGPRPQRALSLRLQLSPELRSACGPRC